MIANRTPERATALAAAFADLGATHGVGFEDVGSEPFDLIINATSASLSGEMPPVPASAVGRATVCYDLAYGRAATAFVDWAREHGCAQALQGWGMLVEQAAEAFRLWRGMRPATATVLVALRTQERRRTTSRRKRAAALQRIVTSSSALVGWIATVSSKSCLVAPMRTATANPCSISSAPCPTTCSADDALLGADRHQLHLGARFAGRSARGRAARSSSGTP